MRLYGLNGSLSIFGSYLCCFNRNDFLTLIPVTAWRINADDDDDVLDAQFIHGLS